MRDDVVPKVIWFSPVVILSFLTIKNLVEKNQKHHHAADDGPQGIRSINVYFLHICVPGPELVLGTERWTWQPRALASWNTQPDSQQTNSSGQAESSGSRQRWAQPRLWGITMTFHQGPHHKSHAQAGNSLLPNWKHRVKWIIESFRSKQGIKQ